MTLHRDDTDRERLGGAGVSGDIAILNYALTLEHIENELYEQVTAAGLFSGATATLIKEIGEQEGEHVRSIEATVIKLGGTPSAKPDAKFPIDSADQVANLAYTVENLGAGAYLGQLAKIHTSDVLALALSIHSVEGRHASALGTLVNRSVTPDGAFAKPADIAAVLGAVHPFLA